MDGAMAPPPKRRKLSSSVSEQYFRLDNSTTPADVAQSYFNGVDSSQNTLSSLAPARTGFPQNARVQQAEVGGIADFEVLLPRQGTGSSSSSVASTDSGTALAVLSASIGPLAASISIGLSATTPSPTLPADTIPAGVTPSKSSSSRSEQSSPSSYSSGSLSSSSVNETSTITSSASRSASTPASSKSQNLTTSAIILEGASSTTTLKTTINLDNLTSSTSSSDSSFFFLATLPNGNVTSLSRHGDAYTTTLDGHVFTVPSISATTTRERTSTSSRTSAASRTSSTLPTSSEQSTVTSTMEVTNLAGQGEATATFSSTTSSTSAASGGGGGGSSPPAGTIAGGVVGGAAGLAVLVLIAMLFLRWYRRKSQVGHQALPAGSSSSPGSPEQPIERSGPGMAERAGLMPFAAAIPGLFRHQNRNAEDPAPSERGFTRVSGRKLPSAFSGGMSSEGARSLPSQPPPGMPLSGSPPDERNLSSTSFYRDSAGFYGGDGATGRSSTSPTSLHSPTSPSSRGRVPSGPEIMTMSPGPQRQPQFHAPGPYMSPATSDHPQNSPPDAAAQFGRSDTRASLRNSRFTEDM